jgi:hypothetical protein
LGLRDSAPVELVVVEWAWEAIEAEWTVSVAKVRAGVIAPDPAIDLVAAEIEVIVVIAVNTHGFPIGAVGHVDSA